MSDDTPPYDEPGRASTLEWSPQPLTVPADEASVLEEAAPARKLFAKVIQVAVQDLRYLESTRKKPQLSSQDRKKLRRITEGADPQEFLDSKWFEEVCAMAGISPAVVRDRL